MVVESQDDVAMGVRVITEEVAGKRRGMVNADARTHRANCTAVSPECLSCSVCVCWAD